MENNRQKRPVCSITDLFQGIDYHRVIIAFYGNFTKLYFSLNACSALPWIRKIVLMS